MSDPTRLVDETADERAVDVELLRAGKQERLAPRDKDRIWLGVAAQLAPPPVSVGQGAGAGAKAAAAKAWGAGAVVKGTLVAVALAGGSVVGYHALGRRPSPEAAPSVTLAPAVAPAAGPVTPVAPHEAPRLRRSSPFETEPAAHRPPASQLAAEGRVVLDARRELREGRPADALRRLEAARVEFADGVLAQEREALTIEALARSGQRAAARARATAFLRAHPESPHATDVSAFAAP